MQKASLIAIFLLATASAGCIVPEDMPALREELGYASVEQPDLVVKARASTQTPTVDEPVKLTAETEGLPLDAVEVTWTIDGTLERGPTVETSFPAAGSYPVKVEAQGPNGTQATDAIEIQVEPNQVPTAAITLDDEQPTTGDAVTIRADAADPDGNELAYEWRLDDQSVEAGPVLETELDAGPHHVQVTVTDGYATATAERAFAVDEAVRHQANLTLTEPSAEFPVSVAASLAEAQITLVHTTRQGVDAVNLTVQDADGDAVATVATDPAPGASEARQELVIEGGELEPGSHTLLVQLEQGSESMATIEGIFTYSPLPSPPG